MALFKILEEGLGKRKIRYTNAFVEEDLSINLSFNNEANKENANSFISDNYPQFLGSPNSNSTESIKLVLADEEIEQIESDAIDQNLTTLRNRVNELGVSEPIVQREGQDRIIVQLPGIQDTAEAKEDFRKNSNIRVSSRSAVGYTNSRSRKLPIRSKEIKEPPAFLQDALILGGDQVATASKLFDENGLPCEYNPRW